MSRRLVVATRNPGKLRELSALFAGAGYAALDLTAAGVPERPAIEDSLEVHATFEANALAKARHFTALAGGLPVVADDSGLEVAALAGAPGVLSRRYFGFTGDAAAVDAANRSALLERLAGAADRRARFVCAVVHVTGDRELVAHGETTGAITGAPRGSRGFGYDPIFLSDELGCTFGEATDEEKARVSHRARAFAALLERLRAA